MSAVKAESTTQTAAGETTEPLRKLLLNLLTYYVNSQNTWRKLPVAETKTPRAVFG